MKEIRDVKLSEFQKEIIDKLDDEYCYRLGDIEGEIIILNKEMKCLIRIDKEDNPTSIKDEIQNYKNKIKELKELSKEVLNKNNTIIKNHKQRIKLIELILKGDK